MIEKIQDTDEFKAIMNDQYIKNLLMNDSTVKNIQEQNISELINNPDIQAILQDSELMKKFLDLSKKMMSKDK